MTPDSRAVASLATTAVVVGAALVLVAVLSTPAAAADGNTTLELSEPFPLVESTHTWQTDVGETDQNSPALTKVELDYGSLDLSLGGVSAEDVSVTVGGEPVPVESVDSGLLTAGLTITLADAVNTSEGESVGVTVDSMQNPILGEHSAEIRLAGTDVVYTTATALFEILEPDPPEFDVTVTDTDSVLDVVVGEQVVVATSIENIGNAAGTQTVELLVNGTVRQTKSVSIDAGSVFDGEFRFDASPEDDGATVAVRTANDTDTAGTTLAVDSQQVDSPLFEVSIDEGDQSVVAGNDLTVAYTVENTGTAAGTQDISLLVNGTSVASVVDIQLDPGENRTDAFTYPVESSALPAVTVAVATRDQSVQRTVDVLRPALFSVMLRESQSTLNVTAGQPVELAATIENRGDITGSQTVGLSVGSLGDESVSVQLAGGASTQRTFAVETETGEAGSYTATITSANDSLSRGVRVDPVPQSDPANFQVGIDSTNAPVTEGLPLLVNATIENTGDREATQTVEFSVGPLLTASTTVTLDSGESREIPVTVPTGPDDAGSYTATVSSANESDSQSVTVTNLQQRLTFDDQVPGGDDIRRVVVDAVQTDGVPSLVLVTYDSADGPVIAGVTGGVFNDQTASVPLLADDGFPGEYTAHIVPQGGVSQGYEPGEIVSTATAANITDSETATLSQETEPDPANFSVGIDATNAPVEAGADLTVTATIENTGDIQATQTVTVAAETLGTNSASVTLAGGASTTRTLTLGTESGDAGEYAVVVTSADDSASQSVTVTPEESDPANLSVTVDSTTVPVEGETLLVNATVENIGDLQATRTVELTVESLGTDSMSVTLAGGASTTVTLGVETESGDAGTYTATVAAGQAAATASVTVDAPATFQVSNLQPAETTVTLGTGVDFSVDIQNTGDVTGTETLALTVGGITETRTETVEAGATTTVTFSTVSTDSLGPGQYTPTVASAADSVSGTLGVEQPDSATFAVTILESESTLAAPAGGEFEVVATFENIGDLAATQTVELLVGSQQRDEQTVDLAAGARTTVVLSAEARASDDGAPVRLRSEDDTANAVATVRTPATFEVSLTETPDTVTVGTELTVGYEVTNTGDTTDTQQIELRVDGDSVESVTRTVAGGGSVSGEFAYTPGEPSTALDVTVASGDDAATATVTVEPRSAPSAELPERLEFAETTVGSNTTSEVELTNTGGVTLALSTVEVVDSDAFAIENISGGIEVGPDESRTLTVTYAPGTVGNDSGTLRVGGSSGEVEGTVALSGTAVRPERAVTLDPGQVQFSSTTVGETARRDLTVENVGAGPLDLDVTAEGVAFSVTGVDTVTSGERVTATVTYAPEAAGRAVGTLRLTGADGEVDRTVSLSGTALLPDPALRVEPESVRFPEVAVGETVAETVTVENRGSAPLTVTRAEVGDSEVFALADGAVTDSEVTLEPGASRELTVSFTPEAQQSYTGYLFVETDAPDAPDRTIALTSSDITATVESNESADAVSARTNASAGERVEVPFPGVPDDQQYRTDSVAVTPAVDGTLEVNVTTSNETLAAVRETTNGTTAGFADNTTRLGNISASTNLDDENIEQAEFTATVDRSRFETRNTNASDISFYRFDEEELEWVKQNTTVVRTTETTATVRVVGDGFSEWTAAAARPEFSIDDTEVNVTTATVGEEVEIEVFVTNTGGTEGTYVAELLLNGAVVEDQTAIIASEGQENFLFQRSIDDPGEYEVQVNEAFVATINITESGAEVEENSPENESDNGGSDDSPLLFVIPIAVVLLIAVGLAVFYARRRDGEF